jgi:GT2 family glycosyltransferase
MNCTLIVPIHNRIELITHLLESLRNFEYEIIFIINDICDSSIFQLLNSYKQNKSKIKVIKLGDSLPYAKVCNIAAKEATGKYLILINSDVLISQESALALLKAIDLDKNIGAVQGLLLYPQNYTIQSAGHLFYEYDNFHAWKGNCSNYNFKPKLRQALTSAYYCVKKDIYEYLGGMDEFYYNAYDGMELSLRITREGYKCYCISEAKAFHFQGLARNIALLQLVPDIGKFWSEHGSFIQNDAFSDLNEQMNKSELKAFNHIVNSSNIRNMEVFMDSVFNRQIQVTTIPDNLQSNVIIANNLPSNFLNTRDNIVWLTTHFSQIVSNKKTFEDYNRKNDLIIDLHSNILFVKHLL